MVHDYDAGKILWLTFSSARAYGLRLAAGAQTQLWMIGYDPAKAAAGEDSSLLVFWMPFQDITSGNHIAQWGDADRPQALCPSADTSGAGELCDNGKCVPQVQ